MTSGLAGVFISTMEHGLVLNTVDIAKLENRGTLRVARRRQQYCLPTQGSRNEKQKVFSGWDVTGDGCFREWLPRLK
jgi:hypothetical protein